MRQTPDFALIISPAGTSPQMFRRRKQCYGFAPSSLKSGGVCIKKEQEFLLFCLIVPWREIEGRGLRYGDFQESL